MYGSKDSSAPAAENVDDSVPPVTRQTLTMERFEKDHGEVCVSFQFKFPLVQVDLDILKVSRRALWNEEEESFAPVKITPEEDLVFATDR